MRMRTARLDLKEGVRK